jgi:hypothetical protein
MKKHINLSLSFSILFFNINIYAQNIKYLKADE